MLDLSPALVWNDVTVLDVHDGDTITVDINLKKSIRGKDLDLGFHIFVQNKSLHFKDSVRLYGLNAPELATPEGKISQAALSNLINGKKIVLTTWLDRNDKYGRLLGGIRTQGGVDVNQWLIDNHYAVFWDGTRVKPT